MSDNDDVIGQTITEVRPATDAEMETAGFEVGFRTPLVFVLSSGKILMPSRDDEGNGPGTVFLQDTDNCYYIKASND